MSDAWTGQNRPAIGEPQLQLAEGGRDSALTGRDDFVTSLGNAVRENPASAALISMGVAWLFMGGSRVSLFGGAPQGRYDYGGRRMGEEGRPSSEPAVPRVSSSAASAIHTAGDAVSRVGARGSEETTRAGSKAGEGIFAASSQASSALSAAYDGLGSAAYRAANTVSGAGSSVYETTRLTSQAAWKEAEHLQQNLTEFFERQPWALGALGLALGASVAAALPRTRTESEWMGEASEAVREQAQTLVSGQWENVRERAERALEEITREARAQGLSEDRIAAVIREFGEKLASVSSTAGDTLNSEIEKNVPRS